MKKLAFISAVVVINIVLMITIFRMFNPNNLPLMKLDYFTGFDYTNLFPSDPFGNLQIFGGILGLVFINKILIKFLKQK